jgi:hypothetical protein
MLPYLLGNAAIERTAKETILLPVQAWETPCQLLQWIFGKVVYFSSDTNH